MEVVLKVEYKISKNCETKEEAKAFVDTAKKNFLANARRDGFKISDDEFPRFLKVSGSGEKEEVVITSNFQG